MSEHVPPLARGTSSNEILSHHSLDRAVGRRATVLLALSLAVLFGAILWSVYRWYFAFSRFGPAVVWRWATPAIGVSGLALIIAVSAALFLVLNRDRQILTSQDGLRLVNGGKRRSIPWSKISGLRSSASRYTLSRYDRNNHLRIFITTMEGEKITIPAHMTGLERLIAVIKEHLYPLAMNRYRERMKSGDPLEFGPLQLTRSGVVHRGRTEAWQSFMDVDLEGGQLTIEFQRASGRRRISIPARRIPNIDLCVQLLKNIEF